MTRAEILAEYKVNEHGIIISPGKFEGEMLYAPYFYEAMLNGEGDTAWDGDGDQIDAFDVTAEDQKEFPELGAAVAVYLRENDQGFVYLSTTES